ncbi:MAG TPA: hypothetical protein P5141_04445, partial [Candidatus Hydrogenedentes bacterium]|nr:hypothetical protein [Candidatus Hydrogenedentota bacterium]
MEGAEGAVISGWTPESGGAANAWAASRTAARTGKSGVGLVLFPQAGEQSLARLVSTPMDAGP